MTPLRRARRHSCRAALASALIMVGAIGASLASEPGDFQANLRGDTVGLPLGAAPPPGLYAGMLTFVGLNGEGKGQDSAAAGAGPHGKGLTVLGASINPDLVWAPGWKMFGADVVFTVVQPLFTIAGLSTNCVNAGGLCVGTAPIAFGPGSGTFYENVHNTVWAGALSWTLANGWHVSGGFDLQGPDGSRYNGTLNDDYWTFSPTAALAYLAKDWRLTANVEYDFHTASAGHTGSYAAVAANVPGLPATYNAPGIGYVGGQQAEIDWSAERVVGDWSFGPAGYFRWQPTADRPGSGWTCTTLAASPLYGPSLGCGRTTDIALGGLLGYDLGRAVFQIIATESVYTQDAFKGLSIFTRLSFEIWQPKGAGTGRGARP